MAKTLEDKCKSYDVGFKLRVARRSLLQEQLESLRLTEKEFELINSHFN